MTFDDILVQVLDLLQRQGRVSYRALKRQFGLDDDFIEDLKEELLFAHPVVDAGGRGLVWTGDAAMPPTSILPAPRPDSLRDPVVDQLYAERRQLTVMFCDLVDSTMLSGQLDPEDYRDVLRDYQAVCTQVIQRFDGHVAQLLGDGLLVYFGYPQAHEDDAERAIRTGLDMLAAMATLNTRVERDKGIRLAIRVGIHTGLVVVGEMGGGDRQEQLALGEAPNIAARLEGLAAPNTVVISGRTRRLVGGAFDVEDLGVHAIKGLAEPMQVYGVRGESVAESRFEAATATGLTPLVGREEELQLLRRRWEQAKGGEGQVVLLCGEPGIGKSRMVQTVRECVASEPHIRLRYQCSPYYLNSAFYPIITQLERAARFAREDTPVQKLEKLEDLLSQSTDQVPEVAPLFAMLLAIPTEHRYPPLTLTPERQKEQTITALVSQLLGLSHHQPVLFILEDAHWSDPTSLEVLDHMVHQIRSEQVLVLITYRPEFQVPWTDIPHVTTLVLNRLSSLEGQEMVEKLVSGKPLPSLVLDQILEKTDGVPLFVEELTKTVLESGLLRDAGDRYELTGPLPALAIPSTLQDSLMARLDRLAPVKEVAQIGAALGREFSYELIAAISPLRDRELEDALNQLVESEMLFRRSDFPETQYRFKHALIQEVSYSSLLRSKRQQLHTQIARMFEERFPVTVATEPEVLAHHYTAAGLSELAVGYWHKAGQRATQRSAYREATHHLTQGLALLNELADTPERAQRELDLQTTLGPVLMATKGYADPEVEHSYGRAQTLCQQLGQTPQLFPVLRGLAAYWIVRGQILTARTLAEQLLELAHVQDDPNPLMLAHYMSGLASFYHGELPAAHESFKRGLALHNRQQHQTQAALYGIDLEVASLAYMARTLWLLGYPDRALETIQSALDVAHELPHPYSLEHTLMFATHIHQLRREVDATQERGEAAHALANKHGFRLFGAWGTIPWGWALALSGQAQAGIGQIREGLATHTATGAELLSPYFLALLAETYGQAGRAEAGLKVVNEALSVIARNREHQWEAELLRLKGELLVSHSIANRMEAETCLHQALDLASHQQAKSLELRAATSLARLWQQQDKHQEAYNLLAPVYDWFTEGFDTADLQVAKQLLDDLAA